MITQGLLIIDGAKNCVLLTKEDLESYKTISELISSKVIDRQLRQHYTKADLDTTVSAYLKGKFEPRYLNGGN